jgi:hypothetical protein
MMRRDGAPGGRQAPVRGNTPQEQGTTTRRERQARTVRRAGQRAAEARIQLRQRHGSRSGARLAFLDRRLQLISEFRRIFETVYLLGVPGGGLDHLVLAIR